MSVLKQVLLSALLVFSGYGWESVYAATVESAEQAVELTAEQLVANPGLLEERLRKTNPHCRGGHMVAINPQIGLVGQINDPGVFSLEGLRGIPFRALDLRDTAVTDLEPLRGLPLVMLGLERTRIKDLSPLQGLPLKKLYLNDTRVSDLEALSGSPLEELMLSGTRVENLEPLRGLPLTMLWLNGTAVTNIEPIAGCPLLSLTLEGAPVSDLSPLAGHAGLKRLHIGETEVTDLSPLKEVQLERLIFTPERITNGLEIVRGMTSLRELGRTFDTRGPPEQFWREFEEAAPHRMP